MTTDPGSVRDPVHDTARDVADLLRRAREHLRLNRPSHAEALAEVALARDPANGEAMEMLGRLAAQRGEHARAVGFLAAAAACGETAPRLADLGHALVAFGRLPDAASAFRRATALAPDDGGLANDLGVVVAQIGHIAEAEAAFRHAVALRPDLSEARNNLATALRQLGRPVEAESMLPPAVPAADPATVADRQADALQKAGNIAEALEAGARAVALRPGDADLRRRHADRLQSAGRLADAEAELRHALALEPDSAAAHSALGWVLRRQDRLHEAIGLLDAAARRWPDSAVITNALAIAVLNAGRPEESLALIERAVALDPADAEIQHNRATILLRLGRFREGWAAYEWRWRTAQGAAVYRAFRPPLWDGEPLNGRRILLHSEQGLGDSLQFLRFVRDAAARGGQVVLEVPTPLLRLAGSFADVADVVCTGDPLPEFDLHCPLLSLPRALGTVAETLPRPPYLAADPRLVAMWRERLASAVGLRVGLVWAGNAEQRDDSRRSAPFAALAPLWTLPGVSWFSLQVGPRIADLAGVPAGVTVTDLGSLLGDFADTAAALMALDLLVTVDTATVHLAGALGRPAWLLLAFAADWRWMTDPTASPWYPSLRLFRQSAPRTWPDVIACVAAGLTGAARRATLPV